MFDFRGLGNANAIWRLYEESGTVNVNGIWRIYVGNGNGIYDPLDYDYPIWIDGDF